MPDLGLMGSGLRVSSEVVEVEVVEEVSSEIVVEVVEEVVMEVVEELVSELVVEVVVEIVVEIVSEVTDGRLRRDSSSDVGGRRWPLTAALCPLRPATCDLPMLTDLT